MITYALLIACATLTISHCCYVFPKEIKDPCTKLNCSQGSHCVRSRDGKEAICECLESCPNLGNHEGSGPVCGTDGIDYPTLCDLNRAACTKGANITVAFRGKCGRGSDCYHPQYLAGEIY
ncbi:Agrin [Harpegnathos saltator]|uniref:Agrin n=1 Tax=Harpegnathos saltator TaxID=610380 RepID=E2B5D2_HARSA|nr:Agrin [Harpegnathos saltator]